MLRLTACVIVLLTTVGCDMLKEKKFVEPNFDLRDSQIIVVPFRDLQHWYYEVEEGRELAKFIVADLQRECDLDVVGGAEVENAVWEDVEAVDWAEVGRSVNAKYVLFGVIRELRNDSRGMVGVLRGTVSVDLSVWDVEKDEVAYRERIQKIYPDNVESGEIGVSFEQSHRELREQLFLRVAKRVSATFCGEEVDRY
ncbi:MAG: hypothetical protein AAF488_01935 [Planctomycetota bacterium]